MVRHLCKNLADRARYVGASRGALVVGLILAVSLLAAACGDDSSDTAGGETATPETGLSGVIVSSDLAVGTNRFVLGLIDQAENAEVLGAQLHFRFFKLNGDAQILKSEMDATSLRVAKSFTNTLDDGTLETVDAGETGAYLADVDFDSPGDWGVEATGTLDGEPLETTATAFIVLEESPTVTVGQPAPPSVQTIVSDVEDIAEIDTSNPRNPGMHDMTIADAVTSGTPTVIVMATPAFCVRRIGGPTKEAVDELYPEYKEQANFIHVEPYDLEIARRGDGLVVVPFLEEEWGLQTEPWVFLVDETGIIVAKFEALVTREEIEEVLQTLVQMDPTS